ncbi:MAG: glycosyltransferase [bacterium]|nr:glycosyltransferase [bacterium]
MKLLFYIPGLVDGGAERVIANLANWFAEKGHDVSLVVEFEAGRNSPVLSGNVKRLQLSNHHIASIRELSRTLIEQNPDIVISAIASANFKIVAASVLSKARNLAKRNTINKTPALVLTYHGFEEYKTGKLSWLGYKNLPAMSLYAAQVVAVSDKLLESLAVDWKARRDKLVRIYNPVPLPACPPNHDPADLQARENIILSVGRLVPNKRFDLLIKAFAQLVDKSASLIILGEGSERQKLTLLIEELGLSHHVTLPGYVQDTGAYYARAKCFALTSITESFGLVLVEALGFGLPVLATDCGGPREVLDDGRYGALLAIDLTPATLASEVDKILENPGDPLPRIERAKSFDMVIGAKQYSDLFEKILRERG